MGISVSVVVAVSSEALDRPVAALSYAIPVSALSYIQLNVSTHLDLTGMYKLVRDTTVVLDSKVLTFGKALAEQAVVTDQKAVEVGKALTDSVSFEETFIALITFIRNFTDSAGVTDAVAFNVAKALADSATTTDTQVFDITKLLQDGVAMNDAFDATDGSQWSFTKGVSNIVFVAEALAKTLSRPLADSVSLSDASTIAFDKALSDSFALVSVTSLSLELPKADTVSVSDTPAKLVTKAPFTDTTSLLSAIFLQPNKQLADNLGTGDSGSLRSQGYADFSYFAEDYVGDSRTF